MLDTVLREKPGRLFLPCTGDAEHGDGGRGVLPCVKATFDDPPGDDIGAGVVYHIHDDGDAFDAGRGEEESGELRDLADARVAADLAVVGGFAAVRADGIEGCQAGATTTNQQAKGAIEFDDAARDTAVIRAVDAFGGLFEEGGLAEVAGGRIEPEVPEEGLLSEESVVVEFHVAIECEPASIGGFHERVDFGEEEVVFHEGAVETADDDGEVDEILAGNAEFAEGILDEEVLGWEKGGEVMPHDRARGRFFDIDTAGGRDDDDGEAGCVIEGDADVELALEGHAFFGQDAERARAGEVGGGNRAGDERCFGGSIGEADGAGFHPAARERLGLQDNGATEPACGELRLAWLIEEQAAGHLDFVMAEDVLGFVFEEVHARSQTAGADVVSPRV